jgi:Ca2+-transporting ATPase
MFDFHSATIEEVFKKVKSSSKGLGMADAKERLSTQGQNRLAEEKGAGKLKILFSQFANPLIYVLFSASIIAFIIGEVVNALVVLVAIFINAIIGFIQENKANNSLEMLKKIVEHKTIIRRAGREMEIDSVDIVVGDIIVLRAGAQIPVDARLISSIDLQVNEASLTGESMAVFKNVKPVAPGTVLAERKSMVYAGTVVVGGNGEAVAVCKGVDTELGKISQMVKEAGENRTPLQKRLIKLSKFFALIAGLVGVIIVVVGWWQGREFSDIFLTAVAVGVAAIPEGLVVAVTVILVLGMKNILKEKALVRKLVAAETLGSTTVICSDKTGTITEGKMQVAHILIGEQEYSITDFNTKESVHEIKNLLLALEAGILCNNAIVESSANELQPEKIIGLPVEVALLSLGQNIGIDREKLLALEPKLGELPFNSENKFMITLHQKGEQYVIYEKGAPEKLITKSTKYLDDGGFKELDGLQKQNLLSRAEELESKGLRVIGLACKTIKKLPWKLEDEPKNWSLIDNGLTFIGFVAVKDPLRVDAKETISLCRRAGIRPIIITGDHPLTAGAVARECGILNDNKEIITGDYLEGIDDIKLRELVRQFSVYARVSPNHKLRIIKALQANGEVVAMTGDGINDSPALKVADIGVCLGSGTDVAKQTADIVLLDDSFKVIVLAVEEGRIIFYNIRKLITYLTSSSFSEIVLIIGSIIFNIPLAILPAQILWVNIVNDGFPSFSLAFEKGDEKVMDKKPINRQEPLINREMKTIIVYLGLARDLGLLLLFVYLYNNAAQFGVDIVYLRTLFFAILGFKSITGIFSIRSFNLPIFKIKHWDNKYLLGAFSASLSLLLLAVYLPFLQKFLGTMDLDFKAWGLIVAIAFINILLIETVKYFYMRKSIKAA